MGGGQIWRARRGRSGSARAALRVGGGGGGAGEVGAGRETGTGGGKGGDRRGGSGPPISGWRGEETSRVSRTSRVGRAWVEWFFAVGNGEGSRLPLSVAAGGVTGDLVWCVVHRSILVVVMMQRRTSIEWFVFTAVFYATTIASKSKLVLLAAIAHGSLDDQITPNLRSSVITVALLVCNAQCFLF